MTRQRTAAAYRSGAHTTTLPAPPAAEPADPNAASVLDGLLAEATAAVEDGRAVDDVWIGLAAGMLARAIADSDTDELIDFQGRLRAVVALARRASQARRPDLDRMIDQVRVLVDVADAGADLSQPRSAGRTLEPKSLAAKILARLAEQEEVFADALAAAVDTHASQLSRACRTLAQDGLISRRQYGRRVSWSLTGSGQEAAASLRAQASDGPRAAGAMGAVTVDSAEALHAAVARAVAAINVPLGTDHRARRMAMYLRQPARDVSQAEDLWEGGPPPCVLFSEETQTAYVLNALAEVPDEPQVLAST